MTANTKIEWADHTFNPWTGCTKVSPACDHCYAEGWAKRSGHVEWGPGAIRRRTTKVNWRHPIKWNAEAARLGIRYRVFCASLADVFDNEVPHRWRQDLMSLIADTPHLDWLLLTKRIGNAARMLSDASMHDGRLLDANDYYSPPQNLWIGATICNQEEADRDIPKLLAVPATKRFLSMEPLLGPVQLDPLWLRPSPSTAYLAGKVHASMPAWTRFGCVGLDWIICGGESGPKARPMNPDWARSLRDECLAAGVPFLFKQWGEWGDPDSIEATGLAHHGWWENDPDDGGVQRREFPGPMVKGIELCGLRPEVFRVGKKAAGRLLDGREWNEVPV